MRLSLNRNSDGALGGRNAISIRLGALLSLWLALLIVLLQERSIDASQQLDGAVIKGWTEINKRWPLEESEFFVALAKGHHFIEVQLPAQLNHDLDIRLEYYYDYARVRPVFQMVPCRTNVDIIKNDDLDSQRASYIDRDRYTRDSAQPAARWLTHNMRVLKSDCERGGRLAYNVLLHDQNDVFAWRVLEIKGVPTTTTTTTAAPSTDATEAVVATTTAEVVSQSTDTTRAPESTDSPPTSSPLVSTEDASDPSLNSIEEQFTKKPGEEVYYDPNGQSSTPQPQQNQETTTEGPLLVRLKRLALFMEEQGNEELLNLVCRPSSCNRALFDYPRFMPLVRGVPKLPRENLLEQNYKYYLSTDNKELEFSQEYGDDFSDVNLCVNFELYLDPGTEIEFLVEDDKAESKSKLLELIENKLSPSGSPSNDGRWENFKRCMDDYMPKLRPVDPNGHSIKLKFAPRHVSAGKQVALLANPERSISLNRLYTPKDFVPNVVTLPSKADIASYWVLDKDGYRKPRLNFETRRPEESTSSDAGPRRMLHISNIEPKQESFDITSRWLKVSDLDTLDNPIYFFYRADRAEWVKAIEFQFQKASSDGWNSRELYVEFNPIRQDISLEFIADFGEKPKANLAHKNTNLKNPHHNSDQLPSPTDATVSSNATTNGNSQPEESSTISTLATTTTLAPSGPVGQMIVPIKLIKLNTDEFRIRVRHHLKEEAQRGDDGLELNIFTLAFADACAESNFCQNGGSCKPTGTASAKCTCLPGYFGEHCQTVKPCEIIYGTQTGSQLCASVGATCEPNLPVFRCTWPNDQYYECRALFKQAEDGKTELVPTMASTEFEQRLNDQSRTIIILSVFMAALLLFSVVIVGNMISRLLESKKRLKRAEHEAHELARRSQPGGSAAGGAAFGRAPGRQKPATVSYNNQAFDTE